MLLRGSEPRRMTYGRNDMNYRFERADAQRLADLAGVLHDLELSIQACDEFLSNPVVGSVRAILISRSLATFAIVTYCRTMASGVRSGISTEQLALLPSHLQQRHDYLKGIRDKFIAHSVNHFEENFVEVELEKSDSGLVKVSSLSTDHTRHATFSNADMIGLRELAEALLEVMNTEYDAEFDRVWDTLESLAPAELLAVLTAPSGRGYKPPHTPRKRFDQHSSKRDR